MSFPSTRLRRLRRSESMRRLTCETSLSASDLVCPIMVQQGITARVPVDSMPGIYRLPISDVVKEAQEIADLGIPAVMLFGVPSHKDESGSSASAKDGIVQESIRKIRHALGDKLVIMADTCLCQYTTSGHCGLTNDDGTIVNDQTLDVLCKIATSQAQAGVDMVCPSAMMDGQVKAIRESLDAQGYSHVGIMSHSAKHKSAFYSPFRSATDCAPKVGDRASYQVPYENPRQAIHEALLDVAEGVDIIMIKPALAYLDVIATARRKLPVPIAAYSVSGEYALVKSSSSINEDEIIREILTSIKRAGADIIITYFAKSAAKSMVD